MATNPGPPTSVSLTYYGHCAFLWQTPGGVRVLIDPYRNRHDRYWFTRRFPDVPCDLALITHTHFDHDATPELSETVSVLRMPGDFHHQDLHVRGILDQHSGRFSRGMANVMFRLETAELRFLHIGDNYVEWPDAVRQAVGDIDILMVTADDSCRLLTYPEVDTLIDMVQPRVVIPMHYQIPGLMSEQTTLQTIEEWLVTRREVRHLGGRWHRCRLRTYPIPLKRGCLSLIRRHLRPSASSRDGAGGPRVLGQSRQASL